MPFVTEGRVLENRADAMRRVVSQPSHPLHYTFKEIAHAALDDVGLTWNAVNFLSRDRSYEDDPTYVLSQDKAIKPWFEMYPEEFKRSVSAQNSMDIVAKIERGKEARRILSDSGGSGFMASLAAGVIDPVNLIPLSWLTKAAQGTRILEAARVSLRIKYGALAADDAVRLGVSMTPDELALIRGVPDITPEVEALRRMGVRSAEEAVGPVAARVHALRTTAVPNIQKEIASLRRMGATQAEIVAAKEAMKVAQAERAGAELLTESAMAKQGEILVGETELADRAAHIRGLEAATKTEPGVEDVRRILGESELDVAPAGTPFTERGSLFPPKAVYQIEATAKVSAAQARLSEAELLLNTRRADLAKQLQEESGIITEGVSDARKGFDEAQAEVARRRQLVREARKEWDTKIAKLAKAGRVDEAKAELVAARGVIEARKLKLAEAAAEGEVRLHAVRTSQLAVAAKIKDHKKLVESAQKKALEGLPSPLEGFGATVAEGAALGAGFSGASEVFLQAVQDGREDELLENSFLAGGILGAVLGGAGASLRAIGVRRLIDHHEALVEELTSAPALQRMVDEKLLTPEEVRAFMVGGKGKDGVPRGTMEERADGVVDAAIDRIGESSPSTERILRNEKSFVRRAMKAAVMSPAGRMFYSISPHAQALSNLLVGVPYLQKGQKALGPSASRRMEIWNQTGTALAYKLREIRGRADPVDFGDQVAAYVMSGGKTNASPEVVKAADEWIAYTAKTKETIKSSGAIGEPDLGVDVNYFPHAWIHDELRARKNEFIDRAAPYYNNDRDFVRARLEEQLSHPLSLDPDAMNFHAVTGSLQERGWKKLPGHEFLDFMHTDLDYIVSNHARKVGAQVEVARLQPNGSMPERLALKEWREKIDDDYQRALDAATSDKQKARILKEWEETKVDLDYTLESLLGFLKRDPFDASTRAISDTMTTGATLMYGGNFGWNSLGDPMGAAFVNGARPWLKVAVARLRRTLAGIPKDELAKEAYLYQFLGGEHSRHALQFDFHANSANAPKGHGGIWRRVHNGFMLANGLRFITAKAAEMNTYLAIDTLLGISRKVKNGVALNKAERNNLLLSGLDEATASRIGEKVMSGGATEDHGILLAKLSAWGDDELSDTFRAAVAQNVHRGVMNPGRAEMPMAMKGHLGRVLFQFLQFSKAANDNFLISGLQRMDGAVTGGALMMLGMGVFIETVNYAARGKEIPELDTLLADGFNRAGLVGYIPQVNEWAAGLTGGIADANHLLGTNTVTERYGSPDAGSMVPGFSAIDDIGRQLRTAVRLLNGEEITEPQAKAFARRIPYMNAVHMAPVREIIQEAIR